MLTTRPENKAANGKAPQTASRRLPDPATARSTVEDAEAELAKVEAEAQTAEAEIAATYQHGDATKRKQLQAKRDSLWQRHAGLAQDVVLAREALTASEAADGERVLERDLAALAKRFGEAGPQAEAALEGMASAYRELLALNGERLAIEARCDTHRRRYGSAPDLFTFNDVLRVPTGFLGIFERVVKAMERVARHRAFLGDAPTEAEAWRRHWNAESKQDREQKERMAARYAAAHPGEGFVEARTRGRLAGLFNIEPVRR